MLWKSKSSPAKFHVPAREPEHFLLQSSKQSSNYMENQLNIEWATNTNTPQRVATLCSKSKTFLLKSANRDRSFSVAQKTNTTQLGKLRINTHSGRRENWIERNQKHCHCDKKAHRVQGVWFLGKLVGKKEKLQTAPYRLCNVENPDNIKLSNGMSWKRCETESERENINIKHKH